VELGEIFAKDDQHHVLPTDGKKYLAIYLTVQNRRATPLNYQSWYTVASPTPETMRPTLTDGVGHTFPLKPFRGVAHIKGHLPQATLAPREELEDVVIFHVPQDAAGSEFLFLRLQLPASVYGSKGSYRFQIPRSMVNGW
jgi:hypothetical protein